MPVPMRWTQRTPAAEGVGEVGDAGGAGEQHLSGQAGLQLALDGDGDDLDLLGEVGRQLDPLEAADVAEDAEHGCDPIRHGGRGPGPGAPGPTPAVSHSNANR